MKNFKIMPETNTSGIFNDKLTPLPFSKLNLPKRLEREFKEWIQFYDNECHKTKRHIFVEKKANQLNERGRKLALKLKKLYPESKISYIGEDEIGYILEEVINFTK